MGYNYHNEDDVLKYFKYKKGENDMKKLLSLTVASAMVLSSTGMLVSAAPNSFGVEPESTVSAGLALKIKGASGSYGNYATSAEALNLKVSSANTASEVNAKAVLDMSSVAEKWDEYVSAGTTALVKSLGVSEADARAAVLENVSLAGSTFTIKVTADSAVKNESGKDVTLVWSEAAADLFEQNGETVYTEGDNTVYTVQMKVKGTNAAFDEYFTADALDEISLEILGSTVTGIGGPYSIKAEFDGNVSIDVPGDNDMTVTIDEEDTCYVKVSKRTSGGGGGGGSVSTPKPTVTPTPKPTETPSTEPTETPSEEPTATVEPQKGGTSSGAKLNYEGGFAYINGYDNEDGTSEVRPENNITRAEVAAIFYRLLTDESKEKFAATENSFSDVNAEQWFNEAVSVVAAAGIVNGYDDGTFKPDAEITRAEFAAIVSRFTTLVYDGENKFSDTDSHWAKDAINNVAMTGWINGYEDGSFGPDNKITRAEAIAIINRVLYREVGGDYGQSQWSDNTTDKWYYNDVEEATTSK